MHFGTPTKVTSFNSCHLTSGKSCLTVIWLVSWVGFTNCIGPRPFWLDLQLVNVSSYCDFHLTLTIHRKSSFQPESKQFLTFCSEKFKFSEENSFKGCGCFKLRLEVSCLSFYVFFLFCDYMTNAQKYAYYHALIPSRALS